MQVRWTLYDFTFCVMETELVNFDIDIDGLTILYMLNLHLNVTM